jgi:methionyl-tRNA synthetase
MSRTIVIAATPTPNGDLHVGHMAGPYLASDVYARYLRSIGRPVVYTTCTDDSQSYVVSTAHRLGTTPERLCATSTGAIQRSLDAMGISMTALPPIDESYRAAVLDFVTRLHAQGRLKARTVRLPVASGTFLYDGLVSGTCPVCLAGSCGGACEGCGHPNNFDELMEPRSTVDPSAPVSYQERTILVLPMEEYRDRLTAYYQAQEGRWRPHAMQLIKELLARRLPDAPVTIPGRWGIPAPFAETPGQVLYPWIEAMPAVMYSTAEPGQAYDEQWKAARCNELVYFHGFDNVYHWGLMDLVALMAHGADYITPSANVCNEFYDLADEKFSTSRNHLIWSVDLLAEIPRDLVRFYLALTAPEYQRTTFTTEALRRVVTRRLIDPWNEVAGTLANSERSLTTSAAGRRKAEAIAERFRGCYELPGFSMRRAAETVVGQLARVLAEAGRTTSGDLLLQVRALLAGAAPILIDLTADVDPTAVFDLPRLPAVERVAVAVGGE